MGDNLTLNDFIAFDIDEEDFDYIYGKDDKGVQKVWIK